MMSVLNHELSRYYKAIRTSHLSKDSTEYTYRTPFENFITSLSDEYRLRHEPKRVRDLGAPDFKAFRKSVRVGYIETKDLGKNLDEIMESKQVERYRESITNLILTDYRRFILIRNNLVVFDLSIFSLSDLRNLKFRIPHQNALQLKELLDTFFRHSPDQITSAKELAGELSRRAKLLRFYSVEQLKEDRNKKNETGRKSSVYSFYQGMKELHDEFTIDECADAYAQTITYGLFLAKYMSAGQDIERDTAWTFIPKSIGIIRKMFGNISGDSLPGHLTWIVDELVDVLNASDMKQVLSEIKSTRGRMDRDPFTFFYEDFLSEYDPKKRKQLGVYYTPKPVVSFIVNSIGQILKHNFNKPHGFADDDVALLDFAAGTGTFLWQVFQSTLVELMRGNLKGLIEEKIENHILKDFYGFELLITPYVIAHLKLTAMLKGTWNYEFKPEDRVQVYLTNTLEPTRVHGLLPFLGEITEESVVANTVKGPDKHLLVILGNPPYSGLSANTGEWIDEKLRVGYVRRDGNRDDGYYTVDGKPLGEKNPKWLQDDYVKFIRYAQWKMDMAGEGIVGLITNHGYLDNPTFKGMRQSLLSSFDRIYILNLHGSILKKERCPDGSKDENVFDIRQGVAIGLFIKNKQLKGNKLFYSDLYGTREKKYKWLKTKRQMQDIKWEEMNPTSPYYYFIPMENSLQEEYQKYWSIIEIFDLYSVGVVTARDKLTLAWTLDEAWQTASKFAVMKSEAARAEFNLGEDARDWKVKLAQEDLINSGLKKERVVPILFKPFDIRHTYYTGNSRGFHCMPRGEVMQHMLKENLGLVFQRNETLRIPYSHFMVSDVLVAHKCVSSNSICYFAPLYIYTNSGSAGQRKPNLKPPFLKHLQKMYEKEPTPDEVFSYIYAICHSRAFRMRYENLLRRDFPRIPFTSDYRIFKRLATTGKRLVDLHLMRRKLKSTVKFDVQGANVVSLVKYRDNKVRINKSQFFDGIDKGVWDYHVGGYRVLDKWLKNRRKTSLSGKDIEHFIQIVETIGQTMSIMDKIDKVEFL